MKNLADIYGFGGITSLGQGLGYLATPGFTIAGVALTIYLIIGAFKYLTSGGDKNAVASAQQTITHSFIGFLLLIVIFLIFEYVPRAFGIDVHLIKE